MILLQLNVVVPPRQGMCFVVGAGSCRQHGHSFYYVTFS